MYNDLYGFLMIFDFRGFHWCFWVTKTWFVMATDGSSFFLASNTQISLTPALEQTFRRTEFSRGVCRMVHRRCQYSRPRQILGASPLYKEFAGKSHASVAQGQADDEGQEETLLGDVSMAGGEVGGVFGSCFYDCSGCSVGSARAAWYYWQPPGSKEGLGVLWLASVLFKLSIIIVVIWILLRCGNSMLWELLINRPNICIDSNLHLFVSKVCTYMVLFQICTFTLQLCGVFFFQIRNRGGRRLLWRRLLRNPKEGGRPDQGLGPNSSRWCRDTGNFVRPGASL